MAVSGVSVGEDTVGSGEAVPDGSYVGVTDRFGEVVSDGSGEGGSVVLKIEVSEVSVVGVGKSSTLQLTRAIEQTQITIMKRNKFRRGDFNFKEFSLVGNVKQLL